MVLDRLLFFFGDVLFALRIGDDRRGHREVVAGPEVSPLELLSRGGRTPEGVPASSYLGAIGQWRGEDDGTIF